MRIAAGLHPHNAKYWGPEIEERLRALLRDKRTSCLGEIGLDYHYDLSPREDQERAFRAQVRIAKEAGLPVMLHIREAHDDALAIVRDEGWREAGCILHCFRNDWGTLEPWIEAGCSVTFGGALTFNNGDAIRDAAARVPEMQLMVETDSPYICGQAIAWRGVRARYGGVHRERARGCARRGGGGAPGLVPPRAHERGEHAEPPAYRMAAGEIACRVARP